MRRFLGMSWLPTRVDVMRPRTHELIRPTVRKETSSIGAKTLRIRLNKRRSAPCKFAVKTRLCRANARVLAPTPATIDTQDI